MGNQIIARDLRFYFVLFILYLPMKVAGGYLPCSQENPIGQGDLHLFERMSVIRWENNRDCDITMPLSLKIMEVQIKWDQ